MIYTLRTNGALSELKVTCQQTNVCSVAWAAGASYHIIELFYCKP